ncbi:hypothetical protein [Enterovibrio norvegicus]|uniref:hypothetical protein n=1 Tax=Enterovibrio norvegicus TaxID=188144 RepID=UPI0039AFC963
MSLLNQKETTPNSREALTTESALREKDNAERREYQRELRTKNVAHWNSEKQHIDALDDLKQYIKSNTDNANEARYGIHTMKVNPLEYAMIKHAMKKSGCKI